MAAAAPLAGVSLSSTTRVLSMKPEAPKQQLHGGNVPFLPWRVAKGQRLVVVRRTAPSTPPSISEKVSESIKKAEEACAGGTVSGECVAAWDEVEELSAAASHAREKLKENSDPLENYCKDHPETKECRTYED